MKCCNNPSSVKCSLLHFYFCKKKINISKKNICFRSLMARLLQVTVQCRPQKNLKLIKKCEICDKWTLLIHVLLTFFYFSAVVIDDNNNTSRLTKLSDLRVHFLDLFKPNLYCHAVNRPKHF